MTKSSETRQMNILRFIYNMVESKGYPPTVREIGRAVSLSSTSTVHGHLARLTKKGLLKRDPTKPRAMEVTQAGLEALGIEEEHDQIPIVGTVTAGVPILTVEETTDYFPLPPNLKDASDLFMLNIRGESMIDAGIYDGDLVIVRKQASADNGDIVIAMTEDDEATCKRFFKEVDHFRLQPENETMEPIILQQVTILGKVIGLYRDMI
ncbi:transcriptional repressor LexA [Ligilactobacillus faecis]|uniref:LexA repressor n=1 Tax=Ligilactobacillus faecis TaxID=762833 RepID=A0ABV4DRU8_9LACO|nr:transcriptional repressor LexA [Ligilactobacillus faecis]WGN89067.1 transcriptional repressor LexA [Ligilactobacillus faecis]